MKQYWQYARNVTDVSDQEWNWGMSGGWHKSGIDPQWYGRRYQDGATDGFHPIPNGGQKLCFNESDDKLNWMYFRFLVDLKKREYIELQSGEKTFDLRGLKPTIVEPYDRITSLINPSLWIETDTDRRAFFYVDSVCVSTS
jgi:hypothetical protein